MALFYNILDIQLWVILAASDWFFLELSYREEMLSNLGDNQILISKAINSQYPFVPHAVYNNAFKASQEKIYVNGMPLTLSEDIRNNYALMVIVEPNGSIIDTSYILGEAKLAISRNNNKNLVLFNIDSNSNQVDDYLTWFGMPLSITENNQLILTQYIPNIDYSEEAEVMIGGIPFLIRRYNLNWFLVIKEL